MIKWESFFGMGLSYEDYLNQYGNENDRKRWAAALERIQLTEPQQQLLHSFARRINVVCMAGAWCGDCVDQCPILHAFARESDSIELRFVDRDQDETLANSLSLCGAPRVPQAVFLNEDFQFISHMGDRTLTKYRQMGGTVGGPTCSTGLFAPGEDATHKGVVQDWLNEFERAHWIVRLSPRLRERHGD